MKSKDQANQPKDPLRVAIGKVLLKWRRLNGNPTQAEVAKRAGIPPHWVGAYERGERQIDSVEIVKISMALGLQPKVFVMDVSEAYLQALSEIEKELKAGEPAEELQRHPHAYTQEDLLRSLEPFIDVLKKGILLLHAVVKVDLEESR